MNQLSEGAKAPDFQLQTPDGASFRLYDALAMGPVVLAFYKGTCPTCQFTFPFLEKIQAISGSGSSARIVGVSQDNPIDTRKFILENGLSFDVVIDEHPYTVSASYGLQYVPALFVVDGNGVIGTSDSGFRKSTLEEIGKVLAAGASRPWVPLFRSDDGLPASRPG
jgi:peroxiredoxin